MKTQEKKLSVVIADDEQAIREMLSRRLLKDGYSVVGVAVNGAQAIALAERTKPDILILDEFMPGLAGREAAPLIRAKSPGTTIVAFSGSLNSAPPWADAYLSKSAHIMIGSLLEAMAVNTPA